MGDAETAHPPEDLLDLLDLLVVDGLRLVQRRANAHFGGWPALVCPTN